MIHHPMKSFFVFHFVSGRVENRREDVVSPSLIEILLRQHERVERHHLLIVFILSAHADWQTYLRRARFIATLNRNYLEKPSTKPRTTPSKLRCVLSDKYYYAIPSVPLDQL